MRYECEKFSFDISSNAIYNSHLRFTFILLNKTVPRQLPVIPFKIQLIMFKTNVLSYKTGGGVTRIGQYTIFKINESIINY